MNVTDIDDKVNDIFGSISLSWFSYLQIIKRARERHLMKKYMDDSSMPIDKILEDCQLALKVNSKKYLSSAFKDRSLSF